MEDPSQDEVTPVLGNNPIPLLAPVPGPTSSSSINYLWSHQFYKRLMGPLNLSAPKKKSPNFSINSHSLAYDFLTKDQGYYSPSTTVIDPPSSDDPFRQLYHNI